MLDALDLDVLLLLELLERASDPTERVRHGEREARPHRQRKDRGQEQKAHHQHELSSDDGSNVGDVARQDDSELAPSSDVKARFETGDDPVLARTFDALGHRVRELHGVDRELLRSNNESVVSRSVQDGELEPQLAAILATYRFPSI